MAYGEIGGLNTEDDDETAFELFDTTAKSVIARAIGAGLISQPQGPLSDVLHDISMGVATMRPGGDAELFAESLDTLHVLTQQRVMHSAGAEVIACQDGSPLLMYGG